MKNWDMISMSFRREKAVTKTYGSTGGKGLDDAALLVSLDDLINGVSALNNVDAVAKTLAGELKNAASRDTIENQSVVEGRGNDLCPAGLLILPHNEEVAGTGLGAVLLLSVQPENLAETTAAGLNGSQQRGAVVGTDLGVAESTNPGANHILGTRVELHAADGRVHDGHVGADDVEHGLGRCLNAELGLGSDHGRAEVKEGAGALAGQPLWAIDSHEGGDELLEFGGREGGQGDAGGGHEHALAVAVGAEQAKLAVEAAEDLETLEAFGGVVKDGGSRHERDGTVGLQFRGGPASADLPGGSDHVVGGDGLGTGIGGGGIGDGTRVLGAGVSELGGVELLVGGLGAVGSLAVGNGLELVLNGGGSQIDILVAMVQTGGDGAGSHCDCRYESDVCVTDGVVGYMKNLGVGGVEGSDLWLLEQSNR